MKYQCLVIDDDQTIAEATAEYFNMFDVKSAYVTGYDEAVAFLEQNEVSLLLLDINLGERSGFALCKELRQTHDMPILFISARTGNDDILTALRIGGDDYITKPFTLSILLAKVQAILKRYEKAAEAAKAVSAKAVSGGEIQERIPITPLISLDTSQRKILRGSDILNLKAMEYKMLLYLLTHRGRVVTKDEFLKNVWEDEFTGEGTLSVHIRHLREKIEADPNAPEIIKTVWGVGYIMEDAKE